MNQLASILVVVTGFKIVWSEFAIDKLSESLTKERSIPDAVVGGVVKLPSGAALIALRH
jgi:hypothetical protein